MARKIAVLRHGIQVNLELVEAFNLFGDKVGFRGCLMKFPGRTVEVYESSDPEGYEVILNWLKLNRLHVLNKKSPAKIADVICLP